MGEGEKGSLSSYRFAGPTVGDHVLTTDPLTVAPMQQVVMLNERHPSDVVFLPDVDHLDSGYVFITQEFDRHVVTCFRWDPAGGMVSLGEVAQGFPAGGPNFLFLAASTTSFISELPAATGGGASC